MGLKTVWDVEYSASYFLGRFEFIIEELWCINFFQENGRCCVLGHLGCRPRHEGGMTLEGDKLIDLFGRFLVHDPAYVNNTKHAATEVGVPIKVAEQGPRARVLAALRIIQEKGG